MKKYFFPVSLLMLLILKIISRMLSFSTNNTLWGMICFMLFCLVNLLGCIQNLICRKRNGKSMLLFGFLTCVFSVWLLVSAVIVITIPLPLY